MNNTDDKSLLFSSNSNKPLGEILVEAGLVSLAQIEIALQEQSESNLKIGEILALHGWIKQETADFFVEQWVKLLAEEQKQPLVYYFKESGLLEEAQISALLKEQQKQQKIQGRKIRFHHLAVERGVLKRITVDYFLASLFNIYSSGVFSFTKPYEVLRSYTNGETDFRRTKLSSAPLMGISLKKVLLDESNLKGANMTSCNLSYSSMIEVNLALANLNKAVLTEVNLKGACLNQANLREAHLEKVNFRRASLQNADLSGAYLLNTCFAAADLQGAQLPSECPYEIYYDSHTRFDDDFDPVSSGWIKQE
ncbi:putative low-complexity protein [Xenococcus sp. PCC 7305]|uniref:pentapeptide repeat-containing protein n=1 Tax=Xenococcus sp. PCC 7305 TaxID=102125 RepID=UPI0002AC6550|nr:pentapeptide repeat-containing protein [Xenococcus sp. PCC 7305]ELS03067.1 putative low-complexity protein [Xenococcus sp. PCC 7305]